MMIIEVRLKDYNGQIIEKIDRVPIERSGWQAIRYKGKQYKLWGGIRNALRIIVDK